jgi:hypothetical protein
MPTSSYERDRYHDAGGRKSAPDVTWSSLAGAAVGLGPAKMAVEGHGQLAWRDGKHVDIRVNGSVRNGIECESNRVADRVSQPVLFESVGNSTSRLVEACSPT